VGARRRVLLRREPHRHVHRLLRSVQLIRPNSIDQKKKKNRLYSCRWFRCFRFPLEKSLLVLTSHYYNLHTSTKAN
jgi:hypothetical protein